MKRLLTACTLLLVLPFAAAESTLLTRENFRASLCNIDSMTLDVTVEEAFGEPLLSSRLKWQSGPNTSSDCLSGLTAVWLTARGSNDQIRYIKLAPFIDPPGDQFSPTATESPTWSSLFCETPAEGARCDDGNSAREFFEQSFQIENFSVVTSTRAISSITSSIDNNTTEQKLDNDDFSLDSLLEEAVAAAAGATEQEPEQEVPVLSSEQLAALEQARQEEHAQMALNNVVTLIASSLAEFRAADHTCETDRTTANWVQARGACQLNFRSETSHHFICGDGERNIRSTRRANIDLSRDLRRVTPVRISDEGWATVVLELNDKIRTTSEGPYKTDRWHFTSSAEGVADLQQLAGSILTLKDYCESGHSG